MDDTFLLCERKGRGSNVLDSIWKVVWWIQVVLHAPASVKVSRENSNRRVDSELLIDRALHSCGTWRASLLPRWWPLKHDCGNDFQVVSCHVYRQRVGGLQWRSWLQAWVEVVSSAWSHSLSCMMCILRNGTTAVEVSLGCAGMWFSPQPRHSETCGWGTGNFHGRCEPACWFWEFLSILCNTWESENQVHSVDKMSVLSASYPSGSYGAGGETGAPLLLQPANNCCARATLWQYHYCSRLSWVQVCNCR